MTTKLFVLLILSVFASEKKENDAENGPKYEEKMKNNEENPILVKIEEDEDVKMNKKSKYFGVYYHTASSKWKTQRSINKNKNAYNGCYDDEETAAHASDTLAINLMENGKRKLKLNFPHDQIEVYPETDKTSKYIGVAYDKKRSSWKVQRWSKNENRQCSNGYYDDEETAAHASDTLTRKLLENNEGTHRLNFPDDYTEVYSEKKGTSKYIGVSYNKIRSKWYANRLCKDQKKLIGYGFYDDEETAAHASDTLARKLMKNSEQGHKLNFPDDHTEVYREEKITTSKYIGVSESNLKWRVQRWSKNEKKRFCYGCYDDEEAAAHASDTMARKLMKNGEQAHKLNFPDNDTEIYPQENQNKKRTRSKCLDLVHLQNK